MKNAIRQLLRSMMRLGGQTRPGRFLLRQLLETAMEETRDVRHHGLALTLTAPNALCEWRAKTFSTKEPETLEWIDAIPQTAVLWDIGANVGLYSVYAAKKTGCRVWAFEPSVFNLEQLARNIQLNGLSSQVCLVPLALSDRLGPSQMRMTTTQWGGALSSFGRDFGFDGRPLRHIFEFQTMGLTMEDAVTRLDIPRPTHLKMDVDGIEHFILAGGPVVLAGVQEVLIEVNLSFKEQADQCQALLTAAGLTMRRQVADESAPGADHTDNQIWTRQ